MIAPVSQCPKEDAGGNLLNFQPIPDPPVLACPLLPVWSDGLTKHQGMTGVPDPDEISIATTAAEPTLHPAMQRARGAGRLSTQTRDGKTRLADLFQDGCAKIRLPRAHGSALEAVLINTAGGLTDGDHLSWQVGASPASRMVLTTQACERVYKSMGGHATIDTTIAIGAQAHVDWLPQETILFEYSRLRRTMNIDLSDGASFTGIEAVLLGREAMGEAARSAVLEDNWRIRRNGRLVHAEANRLSADDLERDALSLLAGNSAFATIIHIAGNAETRLDTIRALIPEGAKAAVSGIGERLIIRALAPTGLALRRLVTPIVAELSGAGSLPRLWST